MMTKDAIRNTIEMADMILNSYVGDLGDADLMKRSVPGVNHIAWQLGHLICSERKMLTDAGFSMPDLPDGFAESYTKETSSSDDVGKFHKKDQYLAQMAKQREATLSHLEACTDADLEKAAPEEMQAYAKRFCELFNMIGIHVLMHVGQFVPVRRMLNKPVTI